MGYADQDGWGIEIGGCQLGVDLPHDAFEMRQKVGPIDELTPQDVARRS